MGIKSLRKILIVDDHPFDAELTIQAIEESGDKFEFDVANSSEMGVVLLSRAHIDLVLLEINMRKNDGLDFLLRAGRGRLEIPPVIIASNSNRAVDIDRAYALGAIDFIGKEFDRKIFKSTLQNALKRHGLYRTSDE